MGTQKNRLIETVLLSTHNICLNIYIIKLMGKKILTLLCSKSLLNWAYVYSIVAHQHIIKSNHIFTIDSQSLKQKLPVEP